MDRDGAEVGFRREPVRRRGVPTGQLGAAGIVDAQHLRARRCGARYSSKLSTIARTSRSGRGGRPRCWSASWRRAAARGGCRRSRRPRRRAGRSPSTARRCRRRTTSPPTTKLGASPASASDSISIDVVVVLPCVPATATERARAQIDASIPARRSVGIPSSTASAQLDVVRRHRRRRRHRVAALDVRAVVTDVHGDAGRPQAVEHGLLADVAARTRCGPSRRGRWRSPTSPGRRRRRRGAVAAGRGPAAGRADVTIDRGYWPVTARPGRATPFDEGAESAAAVDRAGGMALLAERRRGVTGSARSCSMSGAETIQLVPREGAPRRPGRRASGRCRSGGPRPQPTTGTRIDGVPVTATSATVDGAAAADEQVGGGVDQVHPRLEADDAVEQPVPDRRRSTTARRRSARRRRGGSPGRRRRRVRPTKVGDRRR